MTSFKLLEITLRKREIHQEQPKTSTAVEQTTTSIPTTPAVVHVQPPPALQPTPTFASTIQSMSTSSNEPAKKIYKTEKFAVNDRILYFDTHSKTMRAGVIMQNINPTKCKIANEENKVFQINTLYLTKMWKKLLLPRSHQYLEVNLSFFKQIFFFFTSERHISNW